MASSKDQLKEDLVFAKHREMLWTQREAEAHKQLVAAQEDRAHIEKALADLEGKK